jgi:hypothetical protein
MLILIAVARFTLTNSLVTSPSLHKTWHSQGEASHLEDGLWYTILYELGWQDVEAAGIDLNMLSLGKGDAVLALFSGSQPSGQVFSIGLAMTWEEVAQVKQRLPANIEVILDRSDQFHFRDQYDISWQLVPPGTGFVMNGDASGRVLEV